MCFMTNEISLKSYHFPLHLMFWGNLGFLLGVSIITQIITRIFLGLHYTSETTILFWVT